MKPSHDKMVHLIKKLTKVGVKIQKTKSRSELQTNLKKDLSIPSN
ncbi:Lmo0850 family protein [Mangrovibacillus cuniculi]|nr:Lmo0850 family protein [Mangrovibacillus cuniculi]